MFGSHSFSVYQGKAPLLLPNGKRLFEDYLLNKKANFLLTNRSFQNTIYIPETEVYPLFFYDLSAVWSISSINYARNTTIDKKTSLSVIDLHLHRKRTFIHQQHLYSFFRLFNNDGLDFPVFSIVITKAPPTRYKIRFRNSYHVFELLALDNFAQFSFTIETETASKHNIEQNKKTNFQYNKKINVSGNISVSERHTDLPFVLDMLYSEEQYLIIDDKEFAVKITTEQPFFIKENIEVNKLSMKVELLRDFEISELFYLQQEGIFTDEFIPIYE